MTGEAVAAEETPLIAKPAKYIVTVGADGKLTISTLNRQVIVESTQVLAGEMEDDALRRLGYTRATRGNHTEPMSWCPQPDGSQWTTALRMEWQP